MRSLLIGLGLLVFLSAGAALVAGFVHVFGKGDLHVVAPRNMAVRVALDGSPASIVPAGEHRKLSVRRGKHTLVIDGTPEGVVTRYDLDVTGGFYDRVLPVDAKQCFAALDVTHTVYPDEAEKISPAAPSIVARYATAFDRSSQTYFTDAELPHEIEEGDHVQLLEELPCPLLGKSDGELLSELGFSARGAVRP